MFKMQLSLIISKLSLFREYEYQYRNLITLLSSITDNRQQWRVYQDFYVFIWLVDITF